LVNSEHLIPITFETSCYNIHNSHNIYLMLTQQKPVPGLQYIHYNHLTIKLILGS